MGEGHAELYREPVSPKKAVRIAEPEVVARDHTETGTMGPETEEPETSKLEAATPQVVEVESPASATYRRGSVGSLVAQSVISEEETEDDVRSVPQASQSMALVPWRPPPSMPPQQPRTYVEDAYGNSILLIKTFGRRAGLTQLASREALPGSKVMVYNRSDHTFKLRRKSDEFSKSYHTLRLRKLTFRSRTGGVL